jgi:uncharacterized protein (TIGR02266 family)
MLDDRRSARRALLSGVGVTVENATGERLEAGVLDMSRGGIFVRTEARIAVGKRLSLEINVTGEPSPWPALGRVVWIRTAGEGLDRPAGLGVRLIDIDDTVTVAIDRLVETREPTIFGVGDPSPIGVPGIPSISIDERESPPGGGDESPEAAPEVREASVAINLVARKSPHEHPAPGIRGATGDEPIVIPRRRGGWIVLVLLLATTVAAAGYAFRDRLPAAWSRGMTFVDGILHP